MNSFNEISYRSKIDAAIEQVKLILDSNRQIKHPDSVEHYYEDKYILAQSLTSTAIIASFETLSKLAEPNVFRQILVEWAKSKEVSLRFESFEKCEFIKESKKDMENPHKFETKAESTSVFFGNSTSVSKSYTTITEYQYKFTFEYRVVAFKGVGASDADDLVLQQRAGSTDIYLRAKESPYPASAKFSFDVNISWLIRQLLDNKFDSSSFFIDRSKRTCRTPRRNDDIEEALRAFTQLYIWCGQVIDYLQKLFKVELNFLPSGSPAPPAPPVSSSLDTSDVFQPVIALFEDRKSRADSANNISVGTADNLQLLDEEVGLNSEVRTSLISQQARTIDQKLSELAAHYRSVAANVVVSVAEAKILVLISTVRDIASSLADGVAYIESMLNKQLTAAIGKIVQPEDFAEYMRFHLKKLFLPQFSPRPFSFAVRRSDMHSPEGAIRVDGGAHPVTTISSSHSANYSQAGLMQFPLNASTQVNFGGDRYLHALLLHSFQNSAGPRLELVCEARQFSGFIVLIGRILSASVFEPSHGIIVRDKDELKIPLDLETIPTPKEFKDAIKSLSPEQQRFAQAFRSMQLQSTLFGICVIQIKPQLERSLNLLPDSLTKEIQLTQDLMELFIKYQIPADLLSFDGSETADSHVRLRAVKEHAKAIRDMLKAAKEREIEEKKLELKYAESDDLHEKCDYSAQIDSVGSVNEIRNFGGGAPRLKSRSTPMAIMSFSGNVSYDSAPSADLQFKSSTTNNNIFAAAANIPRSASQAFSHRAHLSAPSLSHVAPPPPPQQTSQQAQVSTSSALSSRPEHHLNQSNVDSTSSAEGELTFDYTQYPTRLDRAYQMLDVDSALRPTIISAGQAWNRRRQKALLDTPVSAKLSSSELSTEKSAAFDLLDALTRSGALTINDAALHVVIAATHSFDKSVVDTVIQNNVNPIERVERSALIIASVVHSERQVELLITDNQRNRVSTYSPMLFIGNGDSHINANAEVSAVGDTPTMVL